MGFALKFVRHDHNRDSGEVFSCERYNFNAELKPDRNGDCTISVTQIRMFRHLEDDNPYYETVGDQEPYQTCYVMNDQGKTIEVIR